MFVVWMCFLALVTASLLKEESSSLHHEEALTKAAKQWDRGVKVIEMKTLYIRHHAAEQQLSIIVSACSLDSEGEKWNTRHMQNAALTGQLTSGDTN